MTNNRERISGVDTAWLRMEHPTNLMMIVGVLMFREPLALAEVKRALAERFLCFPRFAQRAVQDASGAWWDGARAVDLDAHVRRARLPGRGGKRELEALVSRLASTPLDFTRPLWEFHLVENYQGGSALVARIHHCYADGMALIQVMLSLTGATARASLAPPAPRRARKRGARASSGPSTPWDPFAAWLQPLTGALAMLAVPAKVQQYARKGADVVVEAARLATMGKDAATRFKGPLGRRKRAAWTDPLPLDEVKAVSRALGCSINDVLLSMAAGALRDYLEDRGDPVEGLEIRAIVPVNLRPAGTGHELGNHFGLVFLDLPLGIAHPLERVYKVRERMLALKGSSQPLIALALLNAVGYGPAMVQEQVTRLLAANATAVMTNVPGPQHPLYFAGRRVTELDFWVPQSGGIGMGISILSYDGRIQFGIITDAGLVPDPQRIVGRFGDEFAKLMWITLMSPWGE
jgi:diacylglycerol O-acyltransferase / wax synthase